MKLRLDATGLPLAEIDLGEPGPNYFDEGDLSSTSGNLYLYLDGEEWGSLFFYRRDDGTMTISLGQFEGDEMEWVEKAELTHPVQL